MKKADKSQIVFVKEHREEEEIKKIQRRLNIIEGQVKGIKLMIDDNRKSPDVLVQISAINKSLESLSKYILKNHLDHFITKDIKSDKPETIDNIMYLFEILD